MKYLGTVVAIAFAGFASAKLAVALPNLSNAPPLWCPAGIALAVLLLYGRHVWIGVALGILLFELSRGNSWSGATIAATGSTLAAVGASALLQAFKFRSSLRTVRDVLGFVVVAAVLAPIVNASLRTLTGTTGLEPWGVGAQWGRVWLGDGLGVLVFAPLLLSWLGRSIPVGEMFRRGLPLLLRQQLVEMLAWGALLMGVSWTVFHSPRQAAIAYYPLEYLPFPLIVWAALRLGQRGTVLGGLIVSSVAVWGMAEGSGPFLAKSGGDGVQAVLLLQAFIGVMTTMGLVLAAAVAERQQAEDLLRKREASLLNAQRIAQLGNWDLDLCPCNPGAAIASPHLQWSDELYRILGRVPGEILPSLEEFLQAVHPEDRPQLQRAVQQAIVDRVPYHLNYRIVQPGGAERLVSEQVEISPTGMTGTVQDITVRKQAEMALRESEAQFRVVAETAACAFMIYQGSRLRYANPATERITEYSCAELLERDFWDLAHPDFRSLVRQRGLGRQRGDAVPSRYEIKILTKSGQERWIDFTAGVVELQGQPAGMATAYDVTDRKAAEAKLRQAASRERLLAQMSLRIRRSLNLEEILNTTVAEVRQFLQSDRVLISSFAPSGSCCVVAESVDPPWPSMLHHTVDPVAVQEARALFEREGVRVIHDTEQVEKTPWMAEYYDRAQIQAAVGVPLSLEGQIFGVLTVHQCAAPRQWQPFEIDLLEQLATQVEIAIQQGQLYQQVRELAAHLEAQVEQRTAELHQRMHELQHLNQVKGLLLHAVAHDLRTPLQGMLMVLNKLLSKPEESIVVPRAMLECMIRSSNHQLDLLTSLLENHIPAVGESSLLQEPVFLHELVRSTLIDLEPLLSRNQTIVQHEIPADLPAVLADPAQLQQVFANLISNAAQHNPQRITIVLRASVVPASTSSVPMLRCTIADNGIGITPGQRDRLFQLYVRALDNPHRTGIGLGLHRCRQIVVAHGGQIGLSTQGGAGAEFWLTLPLQSGTLSVS
ncbi:MAG TPA: MASE1 domain-containing protein [Thermosynechococcaceae cyanobacterium]